MITSMRGATPPEDVRLPSEATKGCATKPSLERHGAREVELPEMTSYKMGSIDQRGSTLLLGPARLVRPTEERPRASSTSVPSRELSI